MKIEIEIEDKYLNAVLSQLALTDEYDEGTIEKIKEKCLSETIKINPDVVGEDAKQLQYGLAMLAVGSVGEEIENSNK